MSSYRTGGGGGNGTPISIFFQIVGIDQIKAALSSLPGEFAKVDAAAKAAGVDLTALSTNFKAVGPSASSGLAPASAGLQKLSTDETATSTNAQKLNQTMGQQGQAMTQAGQAITNTGAAAGTTSQEYNTLTQSSEGAAQGTQALGQAQQESSTALQQTTQTAETASSGLTVLNESQTTVAQGATTVAEAQNQVKASFDTTDQAVQQTTQNYETLNTVEGQQIQTGEQIQNVNTELASSVNEVTTAEGQQIQSGEQIQTINTEIATSANGVVSAQEQEATASQSASTGMKELAVSSTSTATATGELKGEMAGVGQSMEAGATSTKKASAENKTLKESFESAIGPATALISSGMSLFHSFENLEKAQVKLEQANLRAEKANAAVEKAQAAYNVAVAEFGPNSEQAQQKLDALNQAKEKASIADAKVEFSQTALNEEYASFAQEVIPSVLGILGNLGSAYDSFGGKLTGYLNTQKTAIAESSLFQGAMKALGIEVTATSRTMSLISLANPLFIALAVGGAIVTAFVTNLFGFRDAVNGVGAAIGKAIPFLKPFLDLLGQAGQFLVSAFGQGGQAAKAYGEDVTAGFETAATGAAEGTAKTKSYLITLNGPIKNASDLVAAFGTDTASNMKTAGDSTGQFNEGLTHTLDEAKSHYAELITETQFTTSQMETLFSKHLQLGTLDVSGFSQQMQVDIPEMLNNLFNEKFPAAINSLNATFGNARAAVDTLSQTWSVFDDTNNQVIVNLDSLREAAAANGLSMSDYNKIISFVADTLKGRFVSSVDASATNAKDLNAALKEQINAYMAAPGAINAASSSLDKGAGAQGAYGTSTANTDEAIKKQSGSLTDHDKVLGKAKDNMTKMQQSNEELGKSLQENMVTLTTSAGMYDLMTNAMSEATNKMLDEEVAVIKNAVAAQQLAASLKTTEGQALSFNQGVVAMQNELNKTTDSIQNDAGQLAQLTAVMATGQAQNDAFNAGLNETNLALEKASLDTNKTVGNIVALANAYTSGKLAVDSYTAGFADQTKKMFEDAQAASNLAGQVAAMSAAYQTGIPTVTAWTQGTAEQKKVLEDLKISVDKASAANDEYDKAIANHTITGEQFLKGIQDQRKALDDLITSTANAQGVNAQYSAQLNTGSMQAAKFAEGQTTAEKAMLDMASHTAEATGEISQLIANMKSGEEGATQFAAGQVKVVDAFLKTVTQTQELRGEMSSYNTILHSSVAANMEFANGVEQGRVKEAQFVMELNNGKGVVAGQRAVLLDMAKGFIDSSTATMMSTKSLEQFIGVVNKSPSAIEALMGTITQFADQAAEKLAEGMRKGGDEVQKAIEKIQEDLGRALTAPEIRTIQIEADTKNAVHSIQADLGLAFAGITQGASDTIASAMDDAMKVAQQHMVAATGPMKTAWQSILTSLGNIKADPFNSAVFLDSANKIVSAMDTMGIKGQAAVDFLTSIGVPADQAASMLTKFGTGAQGAGAAAASADPKLAAMYTTLSTLSQALTLLGPASAQAVAQSNAAFGQLNPVSPLFGTGMTTITQALTLLSPAVAAAVGAANTSFALLNPIQPPFQAGMMTLIQGMNILGPAVAQAVQRANASFNALNPVQPGFATGMTTLVQGLTLLGPATSQAVVIANAAFNALTPLQPAFTSGMATLAQGLTLLGPAAQQAVGSANQAFTALDPLPAAAQSKIALFGAALNALPQTARTAVATINVAFSQIGATIQPAMAAIQQSASTTMAAIVAITQSSIQRIPPIFSSVIAQVASLEGKFSTDAANAFNSVVAVAQNIIPKITPVFTNMAQAVGNSMLVIVTKANQVFPAVSAASNQAANIVRTGLPGAMQTVISAASSMSARVSGSFLNIASSAQTAVNATRSLQGAIDSLHGKSISIYVGITGPGVGYLGSTVAPRLASGIGPMIINHPMNMMVGESGPEMVHVLPLKSAAGAGSMSLGERVNKYGDPGKIGSNSVTTRMAIGTVTDTKPISQFNVNTGTNSDPNARIVQINSNNNSNNNNVNGNVNNQIHDQTGTITNSSPYSNTRGLYGGNTGNPGVTFARSGFRPLTISPYPRATGNPNFIGGYPNPAYYPNPDPHQPPVPIPPTPIPTGGGPPPPTGGGGGTGGSGSARGFDLSHLGEHINSMVQGILKKAFANTIINIQNNNHVDGRKVYESQQRYFNLRSGTLLK
jgi:hypothetical protein